MNSFPALPPGFQALKTYLIELTGLAYYADKDAELLNLFAERLALQPTAASDYLSYLAYLQHPTEGASERDALVARLTVGETYFFRHADQFEILKTQILPALLQACAPQRRLRIWSAGCATGEEAYSLAILLAENFPQLHNWEFQILATDLNREALERARAGLYRDWSFRNAPPDFKTQYFEPVAESWQLRAEYRQRVRFEVFNLIQPQHSPVPELNLPFDLIVCRNVLIYFAQAQQRQVISRFHAQLSEPGWLMLGPAELTPLAAEPFSSHPLAYLSCFPKTPPPRTEPPQVHLQPPAQPASVKAALRPRQTAAAHGAHRPRRARPEPPPTAAKAQGPQSPSEALQQIRELANQGQTAAAVAACRQALVQDSLNPELYYYLALLLSTQAQVTEAQKALEKCLYLNNRHIMAYYHLGLLQRRQGDDLAARRAFRNAQKLLSQVAAQDVLPEGDGLTAGQLGLLLAQQGVEA